MRRPRPGRRRLFPVLAALVLLGAVGTATLVSATAERAPRSAGAGGSVRAASQVRAAGAGRSSRPADFHPVHGGEIATTAHGDLSVDLSASGAAAIRDADASSLRWSLTPVAVGRPAGGTGLHPGRVTARGARASQDLGPLSTWYDSKPAGIEQGFTVPQRPPGPGALRITLRSGGDLTAQRLTPTSLALQTTSGETAFVYGGLKVTDATGQTVPAHFAPSKGTISIVIDDARATYPLTVDPYIQSGEFAAADAFDGGQFGSAVAMSSDGQQAVVGTRNVCETTGQTECDTSRLYFFSLDTTTGLWRQVAEFGPGDFPTLAGTCTNQFQCPELTELGRDVAISGDGTTAAASLAVQSSDGDWGLDLVTFALEGGTWTATPLVRATSSTGPGGLLHNITLSDVNYGDTSPTMPLALDGAGDELLASLPYDGNPQAGATPSHPQSSSGRVDVFVNAGNGDPTGFGSVNDVIADPTTDTHPSEATQPWTVWTQQFGTAVALSADGDTALVSDTASYYSLDGFSLGEQVDVFKRTTVAGEPTWGVGPDDTLTGDDVDSTYPNLTGGGLSCGALSLSCDSYEAFGSALALSGNGDTAFVGDYTHNDGDGAVYVFVDQATYVQAAELTSSNGDVASLGTSLASSVDGDTVVAGAPDTDVGGVEGVGDAEVFTAGPTGWVDANQSTDLAPGDGTATGGFGQSVAVQSNGSGAAADVMVGAPTVGDPGTVYTFGPLTPTTVTVGSPTLTPIPSGPEAGGLQGTTEQTVALTATVSPAPNGGSIAFDNPTGIAVDGCEQVPVDVTTGSASCTVTLPTTTTWDNPSHADEPLTYSATYSGSGVFDGSNSTSPPISVVPPLSVRTGPHYDIPQWTTSTTPSSAYLYATGGRGTQTWSFPEGEVLPAALSQLSLDDDGELYGTVKTAGTYTFTVQVTDESPVPQVATQEESLTSVSTGKTLKITTTSLPLGVVGHSWPTAVLYTTGATPKAVSWSLSGAPSGWTVDALGTNAELYDPSFGSGALSTPVDQPVTITATQPADGMLYPAQSSSVTLTLVVEPVAQAVPGPPTHVTAVPSGSNAGMAEVNWTAPTDVGASAVTNYLVTATTGGTTQAEDVLRTALPAGEAVPTHLAVSALSPGQITTFSVQAINAYGTGVASAPSDPVRGTGLAEENEVQATSTSPTGLATASDPDLEVTATGTGVGTVIVGDYGDDPVATLSGGETYVDVAVAPGSSFSQVVITVCGGSKPGGLQWWDATTATWVVVDPQTAAAGDCLSATITSTSSPTLSQLTGTPFGLVDAPSRFDTGQDDVSATSSSPGGTAVAATPDGAVTATATGGGTVLANGYPYAEIGPNLLTGETYGAVGAITPNTFTSVVVQLCGPEAPSGLDWLDGGSWVPFAQQTAPVGDCVSTTVTGSSVPSLASLSATSGTVFGPLNVALVESGTVPVTQVPGAFASDTGTTHNNVPYGDQVAVSGNGQTALAFADGSGNGHAGTRNVGSVEVLSKVKGAWTPTGMIVPPTPGTATSASPDFGSGGLALTAEGTTALVDDPEAVVDGKTGAGAVFVMKDVGGAWTEEAELERPAGDTSGVAFGAASQGSGVSLSADGTVAMVDQWTYGVFVFATVHGTWTQQALLQSGLSAGQLSADHYGEAATMATNGATVAIGVASLPNCTNIGGVDFYQDVNGTWTQESTFSGFKAGVTCVDQVDNVTGYDVALSGDGDTAFVAATDAVPDNALHETLKAGTFTYSYTAGTPSGVYVLRTTNDWATEPVPSAVLTAPDATSPDYLGRLFGASSYNGSIGGGLSANASGSEVLVDDSVNPTTTNPGPNDSSLNTEWVFEQTDGVWSPAAALRPTVQQGWYGNDGALSSDGNTAVVGDIGRYAPDTGTSAWIFDIGVTPGDTPPGSALGGPLQIPHGPPPTVTAVSPTAGAQAGGTTVVVSGTGFAGASEVQFGSTPATSYIIDSPTRITAVAPAGTGTVDVRVTSAGSTSATSSADHYDFTSSPHTTPPPPTTTTTTTTAPPPTTTTTRPPPTTTTTTRPPPTTTTTTRPPPTTTTTTTRPPTTTTTTTGPPRTTTTTTTPPPTVPPGPVARRGYWEVAGDGGVFAFGTDPFLGSLPGLGVTVSDVVGIAATPDGKGYWLVGSDGGVFAFGDAPFEGSLPADGVSTKDVVGIAATPDGHGYWLVGSDGGVFAFGTAKWLGGEATGRLRGSIVGLSATDDGHGYWLVGSDGGVFAFGDAPFEGSAGGLYPATSVVGIAPTQDGNGYWLAEPDGDSATFGDAAPGAPLVLHLNAPMVGEGD